MIHVYFVHYLKLEIIKMKVVDNELVDQKGGVRGTFIDENTFHTSYDKQNLITIGTTFSNGESLLYTTTSYEDAKQHLALVPYFLVQRKVGRSIQKELFPIFKWPGLTRPSLWLVQEIIHSGEEQEAQFLIDLGLQTLRLNFAYLQRRSNSPYYPEPAMLYNLAYFYGDGVTCALEQIQYFSEHVGLRRRRFAHAQVAIEYSTSFSLNKTYIERLGKLIERGEAPDDPMDISVGILDPEWVQEEPILVKQYRKNWHRYGHIFEVFLRHKCKNYQIVENIDTLVEVGTNILYYDTSKNHTSYIAKDGQMQIVFPSSYEARTLASTTLEVIAKPAKVRVCGGTHLLQKKQYEKNVTLEFIMVTEEVNLDELESVIKSWKNASEHWHTL